MLLGEQKLPIQEDQWKAYDGDVPNMLCDTYSTFCQERGGPDKVLNAHLLDMSMWTDPPLPYHIYKGKVTTVVSPLAPEHLRGQRTVAGYPCEIWDAACRDSNLIPKSIRGLGAPQGYFYQVHHESLEALAQLEESYADPTGRKLPPSSTPRRRVVLFVQLAQVFDNTRRFAKLRSAPLDQAQEEDGEAPRVFEHEESSAIYEWWAGPAPMQSEVANPPVGRWRMYHPKVCARLELQYRQNHCDEPTDVDGVRYMLQRIDKGRPFDHTGQPSREEFKRQNIITTDHPCFTDFDRETQNCFVQFQKGNPQRRRPARRRPDAAEVARSALMTGEPCCICLSEEGQLTGCRALHVICQRCLRNGLRAAIGDVTVVDNLLCGCFSSSTRKSLLALAASADASFQENVEKPPSNEEDLQEFLSEVQETRRQFDLQAEEIPTTIYQDKITKWFATIYMHDRAHLYHACSHPACADKMQNWILKEDFERDYQAQGSTTWFCPDGHLNSVLPSQEELDDMNRNLMLHPEYYTQHAEYSNIPLRRYRMCPQCIQGGILMLAMHGGECKQWPGYGRGHQHVFCFCCTRTWGPGCHHLSIDCRDPGIQQVRLQDGQMQIGFVDSVEHLRWINGEAPVSPPTLYPDGTHEDGMERQTRLGLTNKTLLRSTTLAGTD